MAGKLPETRIGVCGIDDRILGSNFVISMLGMTGLRVRRCDTERSGAGAWVTDTRNVNRELGSEVS